MFCLQKQLKNRPWGPDEPGPGSGDILLPLSGWMVPAEFSSLWAPFPHLQKQAWPFRLRELLREPNAACDLHTGNASPSINSFSLSGAGDLGFGSSFAVI